MRNALKWARTGFESSHLLLTWGSVSSHITGGIMWGVLGGLLPALNAQVLEGSPAMLSTIYPPVPPTLAPAETKAYLGLDLENLLIQTPTGLLGHLG